MFHSVNPSDLRLYLLSISHLLLLILQKLLLLVVLDLLDLLQLLQLTLLLETELLLLLLLRQEMSCRLPIVPIGPHNVGASSGRRHTGGLIVDWLPGVRGREAVMALGDVCVRPHLCWWVVQYLIWKILILQQLFRLEELMKIHRRNEAVMTKVITKKLNRLKHLDITWRNIKQGNPDTVLLLLDLIDNCAIIKFQIVLRYDWHLVSKKSPQWPNKCYDRNYPRCKQYSLNTGTLYTVGSSLVSVQTGCRHSFNFVQFAFLSGEGYKWATYSRPVLNVY